MLSNFRILFFACCLGIFLLPTTSQAQTTLSGKVINDQGQPLVGANVYVTDLRLGDATDEEGRYEIANLPSGRYQLKVSYLGYATQVQPTQVQGDVSRLLVNIQLSPEPFATKALTVTATRADEKTPVTYTNLDEEAIAANNLGQDVPYLLKWTPSTVVTSDAGTGIGYTGIWIRGSDPTRTNVTINGIPYNDSESQGVFWVNLPDFSSSAAEIQVQRGVGTSTNGTGAFGATVNFNTNQVREEAYVDLNGGIGSFGTRRGNIRMGTGLLKDKFSIDARLSNIYSDGYIDRASADLQSWYLSATALGEKSVLRFNAFGGHEVTYQAWNGVDASLVDDPVLRRSNTAGTDRPGEPHDNEVDDYRQTHFQLLWDQQLNKNLSLHLAGHYTIGMGFFEQYRAGEDLVDYGINPLSIGDTIISTTDLIRRRWLDNDFYGGIYSLKYQSNNARFDFTLGGGYNIYEGGHFGEVIWTRFAGDSEQGQRYYDNDAEKRDFNIYGKANYELSYGVNAYLDLQFRSVSYDFIGFDEDLQRAPLSEQLNFFNPKAGIWYQISERSAAYASFGVAQREPNRNDFVDNPPNQRPVAEKLYNPELGYKYQGNKGQWSANLYYMFYRDQLAANGQINDVGELLRTNVDRSYRLGLELSASTQLTQSWSLGGDLALSRNRVQEYTEFIDVFDENFAWTGQQAVLREDTPLAFSPDIIASGQINYRVPFTQATQQLDLTLMGKHVGRRFLDLSGDEANSIDPYFYSDFRISYAIQPEWAESIGITLLVRNIFDNLYETNGWSYRYDFVGSPELLQGLYPQAGRNFLLGLNLSF